ncbi:MAG: hypothetical protein HY000_20960 [Planctomycetes bacterium]|nr:hypothetical protein [Planctomycetota bacterium]
MTLTHVPHEKLSLKSHATLNEAWLHDRICEDPSILGLGDVRVLDRERTQASGGRLDILLRDEDSNRRYEVEVMLGATDPSHIIRTIEYWDVERRRYPAYEHIAVLVAEDITTRFLNVLSLMSGSIPLIAIQLDALKVKEFVVLNFVRVLDQTELRVDDTVEESGGGQVERGFWDNQVGPELMKMCDDVVRVINEQARVKREPNYLETYIGLRGNGVVDNFMWMIPKGRKRVVHVGFRNPNSATWKDRFEQAGVPVRTEGSRHFRITLTEGAFEKHLDLIKAAVAETVHENDA